MVKAELEVFGKVYEVSFADFLSASAKADAPSAFTSSSSPAPASSCGGFDFDDADDAFVIACLNDPLYRANWALRVHAQVARSPLTVCLVSHFCGWSPTQVLTEAAKRKRLLLELWREKSGFKDELSDEEWVQRILMPIVFQLGEQADLSKPPPQTFKLSPQWLTSSSPLNIRSPDAPSIR